MRYNCIWGGGSKHLSCTSRLEISSTDDKFIIRTDVHSLHKNVHNRKCNMIITGNVKSWF
jgi:hypothetical protein